MGGMSLDQRPGEPDTAGMLHGCGWRIKDAKQEIIKAKAAAYDDPSVASNILIAQQKLSEAKEEAVKIIEYARSIGMNPIVDDLLID